MHVIHLVPSFGCGGLEKVIINLISKTPEVKHSIISLSRDTELQSLLPPSVTLHTLDKQPGKDIFCHVRLFCLLKKINGSVLNTYNFGTIEYHPIARLAGIQRTVHADHGMGGDDPKGARRFNNLFRRAISHFIDAYIVVSMDLYTWVTKAVGVKSSKVILVRNGIDCERSYNRIKHSQENDIRMVTIGRLADVKNQSFLIRAIHEWNLKKDVKVYASIIGDGPERRSLEQLIIDLNVEKYVQLCGLSFEPWSLASGCHLFVLTSIYEAMPMTILEAMSRGYPVLTSRVGGIPDFLPANTALFFESNNFHDFHQKIEAFSTMSEKDISEMTSCAFQVVSTHYGMHRMKNEYLSIWGSPPIDNKQE